MADRECVFHTYLCLRDWPGGTLMFRGDCLAGGPLGILGALPVPPLVLSLTSRPAKPLPMLSCMMTLPSQQAILPASSKTLLATGNIWRHSASGYLLPM